MSSDKLLLMHLDLILDALQELQEKYKDGWIKNLIEYVELVKLNFPVTERENTDELILKDLYHDAKQYSELYRNLQFTSGAGFWGPIIGGVLGVVFGFVVCGSAIFFLPHNADASSVEKFLTTVIVILAICGILGGVLSGYSFIRRRDHSIENSKFLHNPRAQFYSTYQKYEKRIQNVIESLS